MKTQIKRKIKENSKNAIEIVNLTKYYGKKRGMINLNLSVKEAELMNLPVVWTH